MGPNSPPVAHHDALRIRFTPDEQHNAGIEAVDLRVVAVHDDEVPAEMTVAQKSLRLADGPLLARDVPVISAGWGRGPRNASIASERPGGGQSRATPTSGSPVTRRTSKTKRSGNASSRSISITRRRNWKP